MSLRIPLSPDYTLQTEFFEIERRLRKLERTVGTTGGPTTLVITGQTAVPRPGGASGVDLTTINTRLDALEAAVVALAGETTTVPPFGGTGATASQGSVPKPNSIAPPTGLTPEYLEEDATWSYPYRGLVQITTAGDETTGTEHLNVAGSLTVNAGFAARDAMVETLNVLGYLKLGGVFATGEDDLAVAGLI